jgi:hypothetical protein
LNLLGRVAAVLNEAGIAHALIGAVALAAHGVARSTVDQDLLVVDTACLNPTLWKDLQGEGISIEIRRGDASDPLAGVVRFEAPGERPLDLVIGKHAWQRKAIEKADAQASSPPGPPVVGLVDLILLKLYAGGPQDAWDVQQLLAVEDRDDLVAQVEAELKALPRELSNLWKRIIDSG